MKTLWGYLAAAFLGLLAAGMTLLARNYSAILDSFYPYVTRQLQGILAWLSGRVPFTVWQPAVVCLVLAFLATIVLMILCKWKFFRWLGWVLAGFSLIWTLHTGLYGLNYYAGPLSEDIHQQSYAFTQTELEKAAIYFRDRANELALSMPRNEAGELLFDDFEVLAGKAGAGFQNRKAAGEAVFAGSVLPVKRLGWANMYSSMGITGFTLSLTGEAAVNPQIPPVSLPFVMCHEMAHRTCIAREDDANFAAFLTCIANDDEQFDYSAYYMAYRYCINSLTGADRAAAVEIHQGVNQWFRKDLKDYDEFFARKERKAATKVADTVNNAYIQANGDRAGIESYGHVTIQLVNWYIENQLLPQLLPEQGEFDPTDKDYINGLLGGES